MAAKASNQDYSTPLAGDQYSLLQLLVIWVLAAGPMALLAWVVFPWVAPLSPLKPEILLWMLLLGGQIWLTVLSLIVLVREQGHLRLPAFRSRFWWQRPRVTGKDEVRPSVWLWVIPLILASAANVIFLRPVLQGPLMSTLADVAHPAGRTVEGLLSAPALEVNRREAGTLLGLALIQLSTTYFLGEGLLFRGVLLPKMHAVFGKFDWPVNGLLFAAFHVHKPWAMLSSMPGGLLYAQTTRDHRCAWLGAIAHSVEGLFLLSLVLRGIFRPNS